MLRQAKQFQVFFLLSYYCCCYCCRNYCIHLPMEFSKSIYRLQIKFLQIDRILFFFFLSFNIISLLWNDEMVICCNWKTWRFFFSSFQTELKRHNWHWRFCVGMFKKRFITASSHRPFSIKFTHRKGLERYGATPSTINLSFPDQMQPA